MSFKALLYSEEATLYNTKYIITIMIIIIIIILKRGKCYATTMSWIRVPFVLLRLALLCSTGL